MALTPIPLADLGASLDTSPDHEDLRLYRFDDELLRWVPSAVVAATYAAGVHELRFVTAEIPGRYALVQTAGAGTVSYIFRSGRA